MKILITGATGFIGASLLKHLTVQGHSVFTLTRSKSKSQQAQHFYWEPREGIIELTPEFEVDAVIHLAGENILGRWTKRKKDEILQSRVCGTTLLCETLAKLQRPPALLISGSAIGFYGDTQAAFVDESTANGSGFLADVAVQWEDAAKVAEHAGIRTILLRTGLVMARHGGVLKNMSLPFSLGLGGKIGDGQQYMSWVAMEDALAIVDFLLQHPTLAGPVNMVAPEPATNEEFTKALGKALRRPTLLPMPAAIARLVFGEMADEALLVSTRVMPNCLQQAGYQFLYPSVEPCLQHCVA